VWRCHTLPRCDTPALPTVVTAAPTAPAGAGMLAGEHLVDMICQQPGDQNGRTNCLALGGGLANSYGFVPVDLLDTPHHRLPGARRCVSCKGHRVRLRGLSIVTGRSGSEQPLTGPRRYSAGSRCAGFAAN
jgi:hypothetical protein